MIGGSVSPANGAGYGRPKILRIRIRNTGHEDETLIRDSIGLQNFFCSQNWYKIKEVFFLSAGVPNQAANQAGWAREVCSPEGYQPGGHRTHEPQLYQVQPLATLTIQLPYEGMQGPLQGTGTLYIEMVGTVTIFYGSGSDSDKLRFRFRLLTSYGSGFRFRLLTSSGSVSRP